VNRSDINLTDAALIVAGHAEELDRALIAQSNTSAPVERAQRHLRLALSTMQDIAEGGERAESLVDRDEDGIEKLVDGLMPLPQGGAEDVEALLVRRHQLRCKLNDLYGTIRGLEARLAVERAATDALAADKVVARNVVKDLLEKLS
jgi:hypothetical protein